MLYSSSFTIVLDFTADTINRSQKYKKCTLRKESKVVKTFYLEDKLFSYTLNNKICMYILPPLSEWSALLVG